MSATSDERRTLLRKRSFLQGRLYFNNRRSSLDCLVRDISSQGAKLKVSDSIAIPEFVELHIPNKDETYRAKVEWRNADEIGVGFNLDEGSPPLAPGMPAGDLSARIHKLEHDLASLQRRFNEMQAALRQIQGAD